MRKNDKPKTVINKITYQGASEGEEYYDLEDGMLDDFKINNEEDWLNTVIQRFVFYMQDTIDEVEDKTYPSIWYMNFSVFYRILKKVGTQIDVEPIYSKGVVYVRTVNGKEEKIVMLNSPYDYLWSGAGKKYVIADYDIVEKYIEGERTKEEVEETIRIFDRAFKYDYMICYDYLDVTSYVYDLERGIIDQKKDIAISDKDTKGNIEETIKILGKHLSIGSYKYDLERGII